MMITFTVGPKVTFEPIIEPTTTDWKSADLSDLDSLVSLHESLVPDLKRDNKARIIWHDSVGVKTNISVLYLHGFSASQEEGDPIHEAFAKRYGANLYLARLYDHGRKDTMSFATLTPQQLIDSAQEAVDIASRLGDTLIVMSCSTGGTLSAYLSMIRDDIDALIMYSPNIDLYDSKSHLLKMPWGKQIAQLVFGGDFNVIPYDTLGANYWNAKYHINGTFVVRDLLDQTMTIDNFSKIDIPVFIGYYYRDEKNFDHVVSIPAMHQLYDIVSTPENKKTIIAYPRADSHIISTWIFSHQYEDVLADTYAFADTILRLRAIL